MTGIQNILPDQMSSYQNQFFHNGDDVFVHGKTFGGLKEDFTKAKVLYNDSVRRILDFDKSSTSFPPVGHYRPTVGTSEASTTTNVNR